MNISKERITDLIEVGMVVAIVLLVIVIYVPVAIWEEERSFRMESRFRMGNLYDLEVFYEQLTGSYNPNFLEAMNVVNAVRDSVVADSLYIGEQNLTLFGKNYIVDVAESFEFEYDTTFGFKLYRRDTILDTTLKIVMYSNELSRNDTSFTQKKYLDDYISDPNFISIINKEPIERVELVEYYKTFIPDSNTNFCPLTGNNYALTWDNEKKGLRVDSPIATIYEEPRYFLFSFKTNSHGFINDGNRSWD